MLHRGFKYNGYGFANREDFFDRYHSIKSYFSESYNHENLDFIREFLSDTKYIVTKTSGSTGSPKQITILKQHMMNSAIKTGHFLSLKKDTRALLCLPSKYISGKMMIVRAIVLGWDLFSVEPRANPLDNLDINLDFVAMTPMQFYNSGDNYKKIKNILLGGGTISEELENKIKNIDETNFFHSYGMTETVSHIAIRNIKTSKYFKVLDGINICLNDNNCLQIDAPELSSQIIDTRDIVDIKNDGEFEFIGRLDNVINTGGIKIFPEEVEKKIQKFISNNFFIGGVDDEILQEKIVLFIEGNISKKYLKNLKELFKGYLEKYETPKGIIIVDKFEYTETGKIDRKKTLEQYYERFNNNNNNNNIYWL